MAIIDYQPVPPARAGRLRWPLAVLAGALTGLAASRVAFDPLLRILANGTQYYVFDIDEPFWIRIRFALAMILSGSVVGASSVAACLRLRAISVFGWAVVFCAAYCIAGSFAAVCTRREQPPVPSLIVPLTSAPVLLPPLVGCAAVLLVLGSVVIRRAVAARRAG